MRFFILFLISFLFVLDTNCQEVSAKLTPSQIKIGDHMNLELRYKNKGYTITQFPEINDTSMGNFRFVELKKTDTSFSGTDVVITKYFVVTCFEDSAQTFPSLVFFNGTLAPYITTPIQVFVKSPNVDSAKDIKPIKDIVMVPLSKEEIYHYLLVSFVLLGLVLLAFLLFIRFVKKEKIFDKKRSNNPAHVTALNDLKVLQNENIWQMGKIKEFYDRISDILRIYIDKRFGIKALEYTSNELLVKMYEMQLPDFAVRDMEVILTKSDLAKFAKEKHEGEEHVSILSMANRFIQSTQIVNDINKSANALQVRKFYAQNKYSFKSVAINQFSFKILLFGLILTLLILSAMIAASYMIPINYILGLLANNTYMFFFWFILLGVLITFIVLYFMRLKYISYLLIFDYNSVIFKERGKQKSVLYKSIASSEIDKKGNLIVTDIEKNIYIIPKNIEYFEEVRERVVDVAGIDTI